MPTETTDINEKEGSVTTVVRAGRMIDGAGNPGSAAGGIVAEGAEIVATFSGEIPSAYVSPDIRVLDYEDCTLLPGLIDTHVHLNLPGVDIPFLGALAEDDGVLLARSAHAARIALSAGITAVRDLGARGLTTIDLRRAIELGYVQGARVLACGQPLTITGGHTWYFGGEVDGESDLRVKVRELAKAGADLIKVMASGGGTPNTRTWLPSFTLRELETIVDEAHRAELKVTAHCTCGEAISYGVRAGVDQIEHGAFFVDGQGNQEPRPDVIEALANSSIPVTATVAIQTHTVKAFGPEETLTDDERTQLARYRHVHEGNMATIRLLHEAGVELIAGTDAGWGPTPFDSLAEEMAVMHECGVAPMDAILGGTGRAATVLGIDDKIGRLQEGLLADAIVVGGNPLEDLGCLKDVRLVMKDGVLYEPGSGGRE
jgi:imidazolonepropionase-like amidohydrolase